MNESDRKTDVLRPVLERLPGALAGWLKGSPRATQLVRDVAMVVSGVLGPPRPVSHDKKAQGAALPGERRLRVLGVRRETADTVSIELERPADVRPEAGQFLTFVIETRGQEVRRSYSLSSAPGDAGPLVVTVKRVPGGVGSGWMHEHATAGAMLRVRGPSGSFTYRADDAPGRLVLIGGGSGITPLMSILKTALATTPQVPVALLYANRSPDDIIFAAEIDRLAASHPQLTVTHLLERGSREGSREGRVSRADIEQALGDPAAARVYLCGPEGMMATVEAELAALGLPAARLRVERFASVRPRPEAAGGRVYRLRVGSRQVDIPPGKTLLEGATEAGLDLDFSCTMGGCGACKARLLEGDVTLDEPNCLSDAERAEGLVLTCVGRPASDVTLERIH